MVQAVENRSMIVCTSVGPEKPGPAEGWTQVEVVIEDAQPIEGWPHLMADTQGRKVTALMQDDISHRLIENARWRGPAEMVRPGLIKLRRDG